MTIQIISEAKKKRTKTDKLPLFNVKNANFYKDPVQKETLMQSKKTKSKELLHLNFTNQILGIKGKFHTGDIYASGNFPGLRYGYRKNVR